MPDGANLEIILFCGTAEKTTVEYQNVPSGHFGAGLCPVPTVGVSASLRGGLPHQGAVLANFKHVWYYVHALAIKSRLRGVCICIKFAMLIRGSTGLSKSTYVDLGTNAT